MLLRQQDAKRDGGVNFLLVSQLQCRDIHKDQCVSLLQLNTCALLLVKRRHQIRRINLNTKQTAYLFTFLHRWVHHMNPAARFGFCFLVNHIIIRHINFEHGCSSFFTIFYLFRIFIPLYQRKLYLYAALLCPMGSIPCLAQSTV